MPGEPRKGLGESQLNSELYFLIAKFLSAGPCKKAAEVLRQELAENKLLPKRVDWDGNEHQRSYENLVELHRHISSDHLAKICERLGPILDKQIPTTVAGVRSLLGAGRQSLLRTHENVKRARWKSHTYSVLSHGKSLLPPHNFAQPANLSDVSRSREISGSCRPDLIAPSNLYSKVSLHKRLLGHLSAVYCVCFDRTGHYIFTGSDDHLVKIWQASDGRLLATLRGHAGEIADMAINYENTILAAGSCDKLIRVWCLKTKSPIAVLHAHTAMVTSLQFCPLVRGDNRYLVSTGGDGCVCFWQFSKLTQKFNPKPIKFIERSRAGVQMLCSSCSPGGIFLATGSSDNVIRVYCFTTAAPEKVCELEAHNDRVDSVEYSHHSDQFLSGSRDGTARIWRYERQEWRNIVLNMAQKLNEELLPVALTPDKKKEALTVTMVCWTCDDTHVVTAVSDFSLKVWDPNTGKLLTVLTGHEDEVFVLEASPSDSRILLSAGHDGHVLIWDIFREVKIKSFYNMIEGQGHGAVFDCKFSPDGLSFAATDSHGFLSMFGFGSNERHKKIPEEVFFHTDYRPLIRDANNYVLDEQTQQAPHLMPPPFLVDIDGNPYPPALQTLVPGRERCSAAQLVPQLAVNEDGEQEVVGEAVEEMEIQEARVGVGTDEDRPEIDMMIALMQRQQDVRLAEERGVPVEEAEEPLASPPPLGSPRARSALARGIGMRRSGETEGVRQSLENVSQRATQSQLAAIKRQVVVKELEPSLIKKSEEFRHVMAEREFKKFISERKKKPHTEVVSNSASSSQQNNAGDRATVETGRNRLTTRALYDTEEEEEESSPEDGWDSDKTGGSDSSEYSDWMGDQGSNLQPPQRTSTRQRKQRKLSSSGTEDDEETEIEVDEDNDVDVEESDLQSPEKKPSPVKRPQRKKHQKREIMNNAKELKELPEEFRPPEWLTDTIPRKAPYVSQMGDQVIYFRQGHELYLKAVKNRKIYHVELNKNQPWNKFPNLREHELVKIVGIKYEIKPPRLCCLKLAVLDMVTGKPSGGTFNIKYHDMPDVIDFLVLKQNYDTAMQRKWKAGDRFRSMIDDAWWMGRIESQAPYQEEYPDSMFQSYVVHWDNGEIEKLSPWDMEPINESRLPPKVGGGVPVTQDELKSLMYTPGEGEWPECGRDLECERIISGMEAIMGHSIAEPFLTPVDLSAFPSYGVIIEYPMDLSTIKARLENHFYRRVNAVQFDVRYVESNAHRFNEPGSLIVKSARMLTETILRFIDIPESMDIMPLLTQRSRGEEFRWDRTQSDSDTEVTSSSRKGKKSKGGVRKGKAAPPPDPNAWKAECAGLLQTMVQCQDSEPFRSAVDPVDYPDYQDVIEQPMDLALVREKLEADGYCDPLDFSRDIRLMFHNSRTYNTNKRSRIYTMTLRLSAMFEDNMKEIINRWKAATKHSKHVKPDPKSRSNSAKQSKTAPVISSTNTRSCNSSGSQRIALDDPSGSHSNGNSSSSRTIINNGSSGEESSGSTTEVESCPVERKTSNPALRKSSTAAQSNGRSECKSPLTNGHTVPYTTRSSTGTRKRKKLTSSSNSSSSSSSSTNSSSSSNSDTEIEGANVSKKKKAKRKKPAPRKQPAKRPQPDSSSSDEGSSDSSSSNSDSGEDNSESGENEKEQQVRRSQRNVSRKSNSKRQQQPKRQKTLIGDDSDNDTDNEANEAGAEVIDDDTNDEDYVVSESVRNSKSRTRNTTRRSNKNSQESRESSQQNHRTRNRGQRTVHYEEDSDDESGPSDSERNHVTMSSRGRLRRLTPRARASLMGV